MLFMDSNGVTSGVKRSIISFPLTCPLPHPPPPLLPLATAIKPHLTCLCKVLVVAVQTIRILVVDHVPLSAKTSVTRNACEVVKVPVLLLCTGVLAAEDQLGEGRVTGSHPHPLSGASEHVSMCDVTREFDCSKLLNIQIHITHVIQFWAPPSLPPLPHHSQHNVALSARHGVFRSKFCFHGQSRSGL